MTTGTVALNHGKLYKSEQHAKNAVRNARSNGASARIWELSTRLSWADHSWDTDLPDEKDAEALRDWAQANGARNWVLKNLKGDAARKVIERPWIEKLLDRIGEMVDRRAANKRTRR